MEFFFDMLLTAVVALLFSFLVAKLVSVATAGNGGGNNPSSADQPEKSEMGHGFVTEEVSFSMKMDARLLSSDRDFQLVDENVQLVDRFECEADRVHQVKEADTGNAKTPAQGEEMVVLAAEAESKAAFSPCNVIVEEMIVSGQDQRSDEELMVRITPENVVAEEIVFQGQEDKSEPTEQKASGDVLVRESEEVKVEQSHTVNESGSEEEKEELNIEDEDDDWEGIERTELEKTFAATANLLEESGKAEEIGAEAKMELYGLHKIATEGSCREAQPMAVMVSARAKWNAWQKLGNMSQEEAMEQYLALVSKEIPGLINTGHTVGKMPENETSVFVPPNSGSLEDPTTLGTTGVESSKKDAEER